MGYSLVMLMRPITPHTGVTNNQIVPVRSYRTAIPYPIICVLGLAVFLKVVSSPNNNNFNGQDSGGRDSENFENLCGYYPGVIGMYRLSRERGARTSFGIGAPLDQN
jgi:hypothetical protein